MHAAWRISLAMNIRLPVRLFAGLLGLLALAGCSTIDAVTGQPVNNLYLIEEDIELGREVMQAALKEMQDEGVRINEDRRRSAQLEEMVARIAAVSHLPDLPYEVALFETNIVNAAAAPGGQLIVFSGLYHPEDGLVKDEDELAAVLAHEIAHVTCRHSTESMTRELPVKLLLLGGALYAELDDNDDLALALGASFLVYEGLVLPRYSRRDEAEADAVGLMYMAKAGYDPRAAVRLWKRAAEQEEDEGLFGFMSSHPSNEHRYKALQAKLPEAMALYEQSRSAPEDD